MPAKRTRLRNTKKSTNLSIDSRLLREARRLKINLSRTLEQRLAQIVREARSRRWLAENRDAIEDYNRHIARHSAFSNRLRRF